MILTDKEGTKVVIDCDCGCESIALSKLDGDDKEYFVTILVNAFYAEQHGFFYNLGKRLKAAWFMLTKGTYRLSEIVLDEGSFKELKEVIAKYE